MYGYLEERPLTDGGPTAGGFWWGRDDDYGLQTWMAASMSVSSEKCPAKIKQTVQLFPMSLMRVPQLSSPCYATDSLPPLAVVQLVGNIWQSRLGHHCG